MIPRYLRVPAAAAAATALTAIAAAGLAASPAASAARAAASYIAISGSGSSWSALALDQWQQDLRPNGIVVNYNPDGSAAGRADYEANQDDFAASDPPFRNGHDQLGGTGADPVSQGYSYIPDTAGGTAFMYHITVAGHLITNLRLSGTTIMEIFTGTITNWDDARITHDYGAQLPNLPITPVIRSDGSGATYFLTRWMSHVFPTQWNAFCRKVKPGIHLPCGQTEFYPLFGNAKSENGSNNVATYVTASYGDGSIGYDEYAYALNVHYPVVKMLNPAGYYVLPTASNVAVALTQAVINENPASKDFLQQNLDSVYTYTDKRSYPLSSYSYLIVPRAGTLQPTNFTPAKGRTLSTYINYALCAGQKEMAALGYSPLPINLVKGGFIQVTHIPGHAPIPDQTTLGGCNNPTFINGQNILLNTAPYPSKCDKLGQPLSCTTGTPAGKATPGATSTPTTAASNPAGAPNPASSNPVAVTGQVVLVPSAAPDRLVLSVITAIAILVAIIAPPALGSWLRRRRRTEP